MSKRRNKKPSASADSFKVFNIIVDASATLPAKQETLDSAREDFNEPGEGEGQPTAEMSAPEQKPLPVAEVKPALPSSTAEKKSVKPKEKDDPPASVPFVSSASKGFVMVPVDVLDDKDLSAADKLVLCALYRYIGDDGISAPPAKLAKSELARQAGITETWVYRTLRELTRRGYIEGLPENGKRTKKYRLKYRAEL